MTKSFAPRHPATPHVNPVLAVLILLAVCLVAWAVVTRSAWRGHDPDGAAWRAALVTRYWHFLLVVWLALYASFTWITPEVARIICRAPAA